MRDPERIHRILEKFEKVWSQAPDQRMGQLLSNIRGLGPQDVFEWEDNELEEKLDELLRRTEWKAQREATMEERLRSAPDFDPGEDR